MKKRVFIDLDNTMCDYTGRHNEMQAESEEPLIYPQALYGFFSSLEPLEGAIAGFKKLEEYFDVYILTAPSYMNPLSYTEKRVWVEKHLGLETTKKLIICRQKWFLKGDFLIDDLPFPQFEGEQLVYGKAPFDTWAKVLDYLIPKA